jgi:hypothetical protein
MSEQHVNSAKPSHKSVLKGLGFSRAVEAAKNAGFSP